MYKKKRIQMYEKNIQMYEKTRMQMYEKNAYKHAHKCMKKNTHTNV